MAEIRKPFQGVANIIRFNWHFYLAPAGVVLLYLLFNRYLPVPYDLYALTICGILTGTILISLLVSFYVYDLSSLYKLTWAGQPGAAGCSRIININAGFDETSALLQEKFHGSSLTVFDFYDPASHTEISIRRAREAYASYPGTQQISTSHIPLPDNFADKVFITLAAHEIRNDDERGIFFRDTGRILKHDGEILVTEHLRDLPNFIAYNIGFFHFVPKVSWHRTFQAAGLHVHKEIRTTPFITTFILKKNGVTP